MQNDDDRELTKYEIHSLTCLAAAKGVLLARLAAGCLPLAKETCNDVSALGYESLMSLVNGGYMTIDEIEKRFTYHPPKGDQAERYVKIRDKAKEFVELINELTPDSREKSLAFTRLEECVMWANASIARNE